MTDSLPSLPDNFGPTRATLHAYANAIGAIPRIHAEPHDKWWHVSLKVTPHGLETDAMALPDGGTFNLRMDFQSHEVVVAANTETRIGMGEGLTGTEMGDRLIAAVAALGLDGDYNREKFESDDPREYDPGRSRKLFRGGHNRGPCVQPPPSVA